MTIKICDGIRRNYMTVKICDVKGKRGAETLEFETEKTQVDSASAKVEFLADSIDLCHEGAMLVLNRIVSIVSSRGVLRKSDLVNVLQGMKSESTRQ